MHFAFAFLVKGFERLCRFDGFDFSFAKAARLDQKKVAEEMAVVGIWVPFGLCLGSLGVLATRCLDSCLPRPVAVRRMELDP